MSCVEGACFCLIPVFASTDSIRRSNCCVCFNSSPTKTRKSSPSSSRHGWSSSCSKSSVTDTGCVNQTLLLLSTCSHLIKLSQSHSITTNCNTKLDSPPKNRHHVTKGDPGQGVQDDTAHARELSQRQVKFASLWHWLCRGTEILSVN